MWKELGKAVECISPYYILRVSCFRADVQFSLVYLMFEDLYAACQCVYVSLYAVFVFSFVGCFINTFLSRSTLHIFQTPFLVCFHISTTSLPFPIRFPLPSSPHHDNTDTLTQRPISYRFRGVPFSPYRPETQSTDFWRTGSHSRYQLSN
jgi:hypothetical protein